MMRCCFELTHGATSVAFMELNQIFIHISLCFFQFYIRKFLHTPPPVIFLFRSPPVSFHKMDTCNNDVIPDGSNRPLDPQQNIRKEFVRESLFNDNIKFVSLLFSLKWNPWIELHRDVHFTTLAISRKILSDSWFFYLLQFTAMFSGKRFQLMVLQLCFMSLEQKLFTS